MTHVLVTNDFPPKFGGIQSYLYELWRRLPADRFAVLTLDHPGAADFDAAAAFRIERLPGHMLLPGRRLRRAIDDLAAEVGAAVAVLDPALPLGLVGQHLSLPYGVVLHGAEVTVPARLPGARRLLGRVIRDARFAVAAGGYPRDEARRAFGARVPPTFVVPPGVDHDRFRPLDAAERATVRQRYEVPDSAVVVVEVSRLVPRKGFDVLIEAAAALAGEGRSIRLLLGGTGRDHQRLERLIERTGAPARLLGRVSDDDLPLLLGASDIAAMCCRTRWLGLEQEGFGIVFLEAASSGVPQLAGLSGGAGEAVLDGVTGLVVDRPADVVAVTEALRRLVDDVELRARLGAAGRQRVVSEFDYELLAGRLDGWLAEFGG